MTILTNILLAAHIVSAAMWVGAVFMGAFIDPPALRGAGSPGFLVNFIVAQGVGVFVWVYLAMTTIFVTGLLLVWLHPPQSTFQVTVLVLKGVALAVMAGNTLYGSLVTWPKIQFASAEEAPILWRPYLIRAYITFGCGVLGIILGVWVR
jgi:hypothetical protein